MTYNVFSGTLNLTQSFVILGHYRRRCLQLTTPRNTSVNIPVSRYFCDGIGYIVGRCFVPRIASRPQTTDGRTTSDLCSS